MRFIDFYEKNKIIPVVDNDDIKKFIKIKERVFIIRLKLIYQILKEKCIRIMSWNGTNAQFLLNNDIKITLVDYNSESIKSCKKNF